MNKILFSLVVLLVLVHFNNAQRLTAGITPHGVQLGVSPYDHHSHRHEYNHRYPYSPYGRPYPIHNGYNQFGNGYNQFGNRYNQFGHGYSQFGHEHNEFGFFR